MSLLEFVPKNGIEHAILAAKLGSLPTESVLDALLAGRVFMASAVEPKAADGSDFQPLLFDGPEGFPMVAAYSDPERSAVHQPYSLFLLEMAGRDLFLRMPAGYGVVLNAGYSAQLAIQPLAIEDIKRRLKAS